MLNDVRTPYSSLRIGLAEPNSVCVSGVDTKSAHLAIEEPFKLNTTPNTTSPAPITKRHL